MKKQVFTKAEVESACDCFSRRHDPTLTVCKLCQVFLQCAVATVEREANTLDVAPKAAPIERHPRQAPPQSFREGTAAWAVQQAIYGMNGQFDRTELAAAFVVYAKARKIDPGNVERNVRSVLSFLSRRGLLRKEAGKYRLI